MTNTLTVVRDGLLRVYVVDGGKLDEVASVKLGHMPDDSELAIVSTALTHLAGVNGTKPPKAKAAVTAPPRALARTRPRRTEQMHLETIRAFDSEWRAANDVRPPDVTRHSFDLVCPKLCKLGWLERRLETPEEKSARNPKAGRQAYLYRITEAGRARLAELATS